MTAEARLAHLEGRVAGHNEMLMNLQSAIEHLEQRMDARFDQVDRRFELIDGRFAMIDARFVTIDTRFATIDTRLVALDQKIDQRVGALEREMSGNFRWIIGIQITVLVAVVAALFAR